MMMNPGVIEGGTQVAQSTIDALKSAPVLIALVVLQGFTLGGITWSIYNREQNVREERQQFAAERKLMVELLAKCSPDKP
jgi:cytochrome bd-type quinol oxidase subunit 2